MRPLQLLSPAKLNLFLHVTGRREDGRHALQTVFQLLDYGDEMDISLRDDDEITLQCNLKELESPSNLAWQAAALLRDACGGRRGAHIGMRKILPLGGGLGGGSSNAATALLALNSLWQCGLDEAELCALGLTLGADLPVFIRGRSAWGEGLGEVLTPVALPQRWHLVLTPPLKVSTKEIFSHPELTRSAAPITIAAFPYSGSRNDCEQLACRLHPAIGKALEYLRRHDGAARMTGTGASAFACFESEEKARQALRSKPAGLRGFVARGINISPCRQALNLMA